MKTILILSLTVLLLALGCGKSKTVQRIEPETVTDLSGGWNDTDARLVAQEMVSDALARPWLERFNAEQKRQPIVTVGVIRNMTSEHLNTETFTTDFERELLNSGKVRFVASRPDRDELREERLDQAESASAETAKKIRAETGADFLLQGSVKSITDQEGGNTALFYQTDLTLVNIETNEKVWIGTKKIKKGISQGSRKW